MTILVSKYDHCLVDLLYRHKIGELACDIPLIISNHPDNQRDGRFLQYPLFVVPVYQRQQTRSRAADPSR